MVYKGQMKDEESGTTVPVAIKELLIQVEDDVERVQKFEEFKRESQLMSQLDHPNLVKLYGIMLSPKLRYKLGKIQENFNLRYFWILCDLVVE